MRKVYLAATVLAMLGATSSLHAQRNCGAMEVLEEQLQQDPKRAAKLEAIERHTDHVLESNFRAVNGVVTIPTVVHVIYNNSTENISDAQILSQIQVLNDDFRRLNSDADNTWSQAADSEIAFCLASTDPNGNPTTGITRTSSSVTAFSTNDAMKFTSSGGRDAWPAGQYLNIWVCDISGGILGYAQFPGGSASTDGVVIDYQYFGTIGTATAPFNLGRTATHEVGHWLNLRHIWGDGACGVDDFVTDTPTSDAPNYGCAVGHVSCSSVDMVQNYMDYSDDACMNLFTAGQKARMRALFEPGGARASLLNSSACNSGPQPTCSDGIQNGQETGVDCGGPSCPPCPCEGTNVSLTIVLDNYPEETSWVITNSSGTTVASSGGTYAGRPDGSTVTASICLPDGCYNFTISDAYGDGICCSYGNGSYNLSDGGTTLASGGSFGASETTAFCVGGGGGPTPTCTDGIQNGDETGVDCGGSNCPPCQTGCSYVTLNTATFEGTWGIWTDGGTDCARSTAYAAYANSGSTCVRLRDNTSTSVMSTTNLNLTAYDEITVDFTYVCVSMDNSSEDFWLQISTNGGSTYTTVEEWNLNDEFVNNVRYFDAVTIQGPFTSNTRIRFRCDASADNDLVYIDDVIISGCASGNRLEEGIATAPEVQSFEDISEAEEGFRMQLYPNPTQYELNLRFMAMGNSEKAMLQVFDLQGRLILTEQINLVNGQNDHTVYTDGLEAGTYLLRLNQGEQTETKRFIVQR